MRDFSIYQDSPEKQYIRNNLWVPLLNSRKEAKRSRISYLTLPGKHLTELRLLVDAGVIEGMNDLVLCERRVLEYYQICRGLPSLKYKYPAEIPTIALGRIEDLISDGRLDDHLPIDAANLDWEGGAWGSNRTETSTKLNSIQQLITKQGQSDHAFTLFVTISSRGGGESVVERVLEDYRRAFGEDIWLDIVDLEHHSKVLKAFPIILLHWGIAKGFNTRCTHRYTYVGTGMNTRMLKFAFEFEPIDMPLYKSAIDHMRNIERQRIKEVLAQSTIEIIFDEETDQVVERAYDATRRPVG